MHGKQIGEYFAHILGQLIFRWVEAPELPLETLPACQDLSLAGWQELAATVLPSIRSDHQQILQQRYPDAAFVLGAIAYHHLNYCRDHGAHIITISDPRYPPLLRTIAQPPLALSVLGNMALLQRPHIAVVGARKASARTLAITTEAGLALAKAGYAVVSGGAIGCDAAAHWGVLATYETPAPAVVVFAHGLAHRYPRYNARLFDALEQQQAVCMSERLWWGECRPYDFPIRNRIVAGMAAGIVLMQAALTSGAMITVKLGLQEGRDIWAFGGDAHDVRTQGNQQLIFDGAHVFYKVDQLLAGLSQLQFLNEFAGDVTCQG